jgi:hypothetical protein
MKTPSLLACATAVVLSASPAYASPILPDGSYHEFFFALAGTFAMSCGGTCTTTTNPVAEQVSSPPWTWEGPASVFVLDLGNVADRFEIFDNSLSAGSTSITPNTGANACGFDIACAAGNASYSKGTFVFGTGSHALTIKVVQNALDSSQGNAVFSLTATTPSAVPEPASLTLLGTGLIAQYVRRRRQRNRS